MIFLVNNFFGCNVSHNPAEPEISKQETNFRFSWKKLLLCMLMRLIPFYIVGEEESTPLFVQVSPQKEKKTVLRILVQNQSLHQSDHICLLKNLVTLSLTNCLASWVLINFRPIREILPNMLPRFLLDSSKSLILRRIICFICSHPDMNCEQCFVDL